MRPFKHWPIVLLLIFVFVIGALLVAASDHYQIKWDFGLIHEFGVAFIIAAILGGTIDFALKSRLPRPRTRGGRQVSALPRGKPSKTQGQSRI